nr:alpha/beta hydrolases superfamily protein [Tanacetum cinerariifolium]
YVDGVFDKRLNRYIIVKEDRRKGCTTFVTTIVSVELKDGSIIQDPKVLVGVNDFYAFPRLDPERKRLECIEWIQPNMPWDRSQLWDGYISDNIYKRICVAVDDSSIVESPTEPKWSSEGVAIKDFYQVGGRTIISVVNPTFESTPDALPPLIVPSNFVPVTTDNMNKLTTAKMENRRACFNGPVTTTIKDSDSMKKLAMAKLENKISCFNDHVTVL